MEDRDIIYCYERRPKIKYRFNNPMLRHAVLQRMLTKQQKELANRHRVWRDAQDSKNREVVFQKDHVLPKLVSDALVEKHEAGCVPCPSRTTPFATNATPVLQRHRHIHVCLS